jgi:hypothetical protein
MILELPDGKQVVVTRDRRTPHTWLQICAYGASLGIELTPAQAMEIGLALFQMGRRGKRDSIHP